MVVALEERLLAHVDAQPVDRVLDPCQGAGELLGVARSLVLHEGQEEVLLVREVVVDGGAAHSGVGGDVGQRDLVEGALAHELGQSVKERRAHPLAVLGE